MNRKSTLIVVAVAAFAGGMAVDRIVFSSGDSRMDASGNARGGPSAKSPPGSSADRLRAASNNREDGKSDRDHARDDERGGRGDERRDLPAPLAHLFEQLERDEQVNFADATKLLEAIGPGHLRNEAIAHLASHWGREDPRAALNWAEELNNRDRMRAMEHILHQWAETDPAAAAGYAAALPNSEHHLNLVREIAHRWAERDREAAIEWGLAQEDPAKRERALGGVVQFWSESDPPAAAEFAAGIDSVYERHRLLEVAARHWSHRGADGALLWAGGLTDPGDRLHAINAILREVAERKPDYAAGMFEGLHNVRALGDGNVTHYRHLAQEVASIWSSSSPTEAAGWAAALPEEGGIRRGAVAHAVEHWLRLDGMAAGQWVLQLPPGRTRDAAAERVVGTMVHSDPAAAFSWANSVSNEDHRTGMMHHVLSEWGAIDRPAAQAALREANVAPRHLRHLNEALGISPPAAAPTPEPENKSDPE